MINPEIERLSSIFSSLPGIGPRLARRIAFFISGTEKGDIAELIRVLGTVANLKRCELCFRVTSLNGSKLCEICADETRDHKLVAVVEKETDLITLENTKKFKGLYLIIGDLSRDGLLSSVHKQRLASLRSGEYDEVIIALSPTAYGDINASAIELEIRDFAKKITRLGRGIPVGGEVEFADEETLGGALENRR